jgi:hypothetical protein
LVFGCGQISQISPEEQAHSGVVSGYVYDFYTYDSSAKTFSGMEGATVVAVASGASAAAIASSTSIATTDADGHYTLENVPSGTVAITAFKSGCSSNTIVTDRALVGFLLYRHGGSPYSSTDGTATITGSVSGIPASAISIYGSAKSEQGSTSWSDWSYNSSTTTYEVANAPDDGETYVIIYYTSYESAAYVYRYAYGRVNTSPGETANLDIAFGEYTTLSGNISAPSGFTPNHVSPSLYKGYQQRAYFSSSYLFGASTYEITGLPRLLSGDSIGVSVSSTSEAGSLTAYFYGLTGSDLDFSSLSFPTLGSACPTDEANLAGTLPSFSWDAVAGSNVFYAISLYDVTTPESITVWNCLTTGTSVAFPSAVSSGGTALASGKEYRWNVSATSVLPGFNINDLPGLYEDVLDDFRTIFGAYTGYRTFTY